MSRSPGQVPRPLASAGDVADFLRRFIETMDRTGGINLWSNQKNKAFENRTGFIKSDAEEVVRSLRYKDYSQGPEDDDNPARPDGTVWVFQSEYFGELIYLKLKLVGTTGNHTEAACLSFHEPEREMRTPLKIKRGNVASSTRRRGRHGR